MINLNDINEKEVDNNEKIPLFVSVSTKPYPNVSTEPYSNVSTEPNPNNTISIYIEKLFEYLKKKGFLPETLGITSFSHQKGYIHISKSMNECFGAIILGISRDFFEGVEKKGIRENNESKEQKSKKWQPTRWNHIEGAMAYEVGLPLLILADKKVKDLYPDGIFHESNHHIEILEIGYDINEIENTDFLINKALNVFLNKCKKFKENKEKFFVYYSKSTLTSPVQKKFFIQMEKYLESKGIFLVNAYSEEIKSMLNKSTSDYFIKMESYLSQKGIILTDVDSEEMKSILNKSTNEFEKIKLTMEKCKGAIVFGLKRDYAEIFESRKGTNKFKKSKNTWFSTIWNDIEGAIAYQHDLPLLIIKEEKLYHQEETQTQNPKNDNEIITQLDQHDADGIFDGNNHQYMVINVNITEKLDITDDTEDSEKLRGFIDDWIKSVKISKN